MLSKRSSPHNKMLSATTSSAGSIDHPHEPPTFRFQHSAKLLTDSSLTMLSRRRKKIADQPPCSAAYCAPPFAFYTARSTHTEATATSRFQRRRAPKWQLRSECLQIHTHFIAKRSNGDIQHLVLRNPVLLTFRILGHIRQH